MYFNYYLKYYLFYILYNQLKNIYFVEKILIKNMIFTP